MNMLAPEAPAAVDVMAAGGHFIGNDVSTILRRHKFDPGALRPILGSDGRSYMTLIQRNVDGTPKLHSSDSAAAHLKKRGLQVNEEQVYRMVGTPMTHNVLTNATATLRKDDWILLDRAVIDAAKERLRAWQDLRQGGRTFTIPNGMAKTVLEHQTQSDISGADVSMDGIRRAEADRPVYELAGLPLPITHKDFMFPSRQIEVSGNSGTPIDTTTAGLASRRVAEEIEKQTIGVSTLFTPYAGYSIYGYTDFPQRLTRTISDPTDAGWTPDLTVQDCLQMKNQSQLAYHYGPWQVYCAPNWDPYMDDDYSAAKGDLTLRERIGRINGLTEPRTLDFLTNYDLLLVQQTADVARAVVGMDITTVQWPSMGGFEMNFKVLCILVPQVRADFNDNTGIVHGSV